MERLGRYDLISRLAIGGLAETWLAREPERFVVVERLLPHLAEDDDFLRLRIDEAKLAVRFTHPNILQLLDTGPAFFVTELVQGEDLTRVMRTAYAAGAPLGQRLVLRVAADVCRALEFVQSLTDSRGQSLRVVHRDVTSDKIRIRSDGVVKLRDFGTASVLDQLRSAPRGHLIRSGLHHLSPEQAAGKPLDGRADLFMLGLVLYELLTGVRPLRRDTELETLRAVLDCSIEPPSKFAPVTPELDEVVMRALHKSPDDRYPDAAAFLVALEQLPLASQEEVAALMAEHFPNPRISIRGVVSQGEQVSGYCYPDGTVTIENAKSGARWFISKADLLALRDGRIELTGDEFGTQELAVVSDPKAAADFVERMASASRCRR